jgi:DNA polymerase-3 subunit delta
MGVTEQGHSLREPGLPIVKSEHFEAFLEKLPKNLALFLLHGSDSDLATERARRIVGKLVDDVADPFQVVRLGADILAKDPGRVADEASAISMFGGRRVVWIDAGGRDISGLLAPIAESRPADTAIVVEADSLKKGAALRTFFETRADAAAIDCYAGGAVNLIALIEAEARNSGVEVPREARDELVAALGLEPSLARGELAKLMLFARDTGVLQVANIPALLSGAAASSADTLVDLALAGNLAELEAGAVHGLADSDAAQTAARLAQRLALMFEIRQSGGEPAALFRLPYNVRKTVVAQANAWAPDGLTRRFPALLGLLVQARRTPALARSATFRALCALALSLKRGAPPPAG